MMKGSADQDQGVYGLRVVPGNGTCSSSPDTSTEEIIGFYGDFAQTGYIMETNYLVKVGHWATIVYTYDGHRPKSM